MKKSQLYTRTGDLGTTSLVGGTRISKADARLEAYGTVDELNSWLGVLVSKTSMPTAQRDLILFIQHRLFDLGAYLATPPAPAGVDGAAAAVMPQATSLGQQAISRIEHAIDTLDDATPAARQFVLPGGTQLSAWTGVARTVCRRAERRIIALNQTGQYVDEAAIRFVNRLSDYLFALSRYLNHAAGEPEVYWNKDV